MKKVEIDLTPNLKQIDLFEAKNKFILYGGAKGGGKSWGIRTKQILRRIFRPNTTGLLLRRTYPELLRNHILKMQEEWPGIPYNEQKHMFFFPNGSILELGSARFEADILAYMGSEYEDIGVDQAEEFTEYQFDILRSSLRTTHPGIKTQMYLGANPGGVGHGWLKRKFISSPEPDYAFIPAKVYDNPVLMKNDPDYEKELQKLPPELKRAFLEGDWDIFAGQVFSEWRREKHVIKYFIYPLELCKKIICFDWGYNAPGCVYWLAYTPDGRVYAYREIYTNMKTPEWWAKEIRSYTATEKIDFAVLPHDCFANIHGRQSIAQVFEDNGVKPVVMGKTLDRNSRKNRLAIMHNYLADAPDGSPYLQIHESCVNLTRTLPELVYSRTDPEDVDTDGEDHAYDAVSVGIMTKVIFALESGAVKAVGPTREQTQAFIQTPMGEIESPDFWARFKEAQLRYGRTWEHK